ncbi:MAG: ABC transporter permease [Clostridia bacterium]|nr:ABC transporter permease [Clostridia bacterium]
MRYTLRNIVRLKTRTLLTLLISFAILFLSMFGVLVMRLCEDNRAMFYGPLDGSVHVTDAEYQPFMTYHAAMTIGEDADLVTRVSAVKAYSGILEDVSYVGYGTFRRARFTGEVSTDEDRKMNYVKGFRIVAVSEMEMLEDVFSGKLTMVQGRMLTREDHESAADRIVISEELALQNGLSLGDTVTLDMPSLYRTEWESRFYAGSDEASGYDFVISGIYRHREDNRAGVNMPWLLNANQVYIPISTLAEIAECETVLSLYHTEGEDALSENPCLIPDSLYLHLSDMNRAQALSDELNALGFLRRVILTEYVSDASSSPTARLSEITAIILVGIVAIGFLVLLLSALFQMKTRHRELAVLTALGKRRRRVALSFFAELCLLLAVAFLGAGALICAVVFVIAAPLVGYLHAAELSEQILTETAAHVLSGAASDAQTLIGQMENYDFLLLEYVFPCISFAAAVWFCLMGVLLVITQIYVGRINALSDVGGKE